MVSSRRYYRVLEDDLEHPLESYFTFNNGSQSSKNGNNKRKSVRLSSSSTSTPTRRTEFQQQLRDTIASQSSDSSSSNSSSRSSSPSDVAPSPLEISSFPASLHTENVNRQPPMEILTETGNERRDVSSDEEGEGEPENNNNESVAHDQVIEENDYEIVEEDGSEEEEEVEGDVYFARDNKGHILREMLEHLNSVEWKRVVVRFDNFLSHVNIVSKKTILNRSAVQQGSGVIAHLVDHFLVEDFEEVSLPTMASAVDENVGSKQKGKEESDSQPNPVDSV